MTGRKVVLQGVTLVNPVGGRLATYDQIESAGSVYLIEPGHPLSSLAVGAPANGTSVNNLFADNLGGGNATFQSEGTITDGAHGLVERSTKGGIHVIVSNATPLGSDNGARIPLPDALQQYFIDNSSHHIYASIWDRVTRSAPASPSGCDYAAHNSTSGAHLNYGYNGSWMQGSQKRPLPNIAFTGERFSSFLMPGVPQTSIAIGSGWPTWGPYGPTLNSATVGFREQRWTSFVFYRAYIEDLTVSGRTYAEVDALDHQLFIQEVLTPGGRYYGDTFTDPATIP